MIVDFHTHVFPPSVAADRVRYLTADPTFAELYASPEAKLASADDLLASMDAAAIDVSVALGFAWRDPAHCRQHNDYLLAEAAKSNGRIVAFPTLPLAAGLEAIDAEARRCIDAGARGFGEMRPDNLGFRPRRAPRATTSPISPPSSTPSCSSTSRSPSATPTPASKAATWLPSTPSSAPTPRSKWSALTGPVACPSTPPCPK